ncbi:MAG: Response regulator, partial [Candidatus Woesebacteria bacterium GW2011_GWA1_37_7]
DPVLQKMYNQKLISEGFNTLIASDGQEAQDLFNKEPVDLIITDIMMPRVSGIELIENIRQDSKEKNTPIIAWSNLALEEEKQKALSAGANEYVIKGSLNLEQLIDLVKKYLPGS